MPFKCSIQNCTSKYKDGTGFSFHQLPINPEERQNWINAIPFYKDKTVSEKNFRICSKHWPADAPTKIGKGGFKRYILPPSVFDCPSSSLPTHKAPARKPKVEFVQQSHFDSKDKFASFSSFSPEKSLIKKYKNSKNFDILVFRDDVCIKFIFLNKCGSESQIVITVKDQKNLCSPVTFRYQYGNFTVISRHRKASVKFFKSVV